MKETTKKKRPLRLDTTCDDPKIQYGAGFCGAFRFEFWDEFAEDIQHKAEYLLDSESSCILDPDIWKHEGEARYGTTQAERVILDMTDRIEEDANNIGWDIVEGGQDLDDGLDLAIDYGAKLYEFGLAALQHYTPEAHSDTSPVWGGRMTESMHRLFAWVDQLFSMCTPGGLSSCMASWVGDCDEKLQEEARWVFINKINDMHRLIEGLYDLETLARAHEAIIFANKPMTMFERKMPELLYYSNRLCRHFAWFFRVIFINEQRAFFSVSPSKNLYLMNINI